MAKEEIEIEISPAGKVTIRTIGIKGSRCLDAAEMVAKIVGRVEDREMTSEYYENDQEVRQHIDLRNYE